MNDDADDALAAMAAAASATEPEPVSGRWLAALPKLRVASEPLNLVRHLIPGKLVGSFAIALCGYTLMVDKGALGTAEIDMLQCGWCWTARDGLSIPPYNKGARRPILPEANMAAVRRDTPEPTSLQVAPNVAALLDDDAFSAAMDELQDAMKRMLEDDWTPNAEETARISQLTINTKAARDARAIRATAARPPAPQPLTANVTAVATTNAEISRGRRTRSEAASGPRGPRRRFGFPKPTGDGEADELLDIRVGKFKATTLVRTRDPIGPYLLGYRSADGSRWIARDVRVPNGENPDTEFGPNKAEAIAWVAEQTAKLPANEAAMWAADARRRMKRNDPINRRSR